MAEQPDPVPNDEIHINDLVVIDLRERKLIGIEKYHTALQPFNGRDALQDAYEEVLDLAQYIKQEIVERESQTAYLVTGIDWDVQTNYGIFSSEEKAMEWIKKNGTWSDGDGNYKHIRSDYHLFVEEFTMNQGKYE